MGRRGEYSCRCCHLFDLECSDIFGAALFEKYLSACIFEASTLSYASVLRASIWAPSASLSRMQCLPLLVVLADRVEKLVAAAFPPYRAVSLCASLQERQGEICSRCALFLQSHTCPTFDRLSFPIFFASGVRSRLHCRNFFDR